MTILLSANALNLDQFKILLFGEELIWYMMEIYFIKWPPKNIFIGLFDKW